MVRWPVRVATAALVLVALSAGAGASDVGRSDYPCHRGYGGDGVGACDRPLVNDLGKARKVWTSEAEVPRVMAGYPGPPLATDFSFPVVAGGLVYFHYEESDPSELFTRTMNYHSRHGGVRKVEVLARKLSDEDRLKFASISTDDIVLGIDATDGRTRWKTVFRGYGVRRKRYSPMLTPCAAYGRVFVMGSGGHVYALDAATGEPVWESDFGLFHRHVTQMRALTLKTRVRASAGDKDALNTCPTFADGVIVCCAHDANRMSGRNKEPNAAIGLDAATGRRLWEIPAVMNRWVTPIRWVHRGRDYVILGGQGGATAVEPRTGRIRWVIPPHGGDATPEREDLKVTGSFFNVTPTASEDYLVAAKNFGKGGGKGPEDKGPTCWRISPEGAKEIWSLDASLIPHMSMAAAAISGGHVYFHGGDGVLCVELATGKVLGSCKASSFERTCALTATGDRVFVKDRGENGGVWMALRTAEGLTPAPGLVGPIDTYTVPSPADGRLYLRGDGRLICYDLRAASDVAATPVKDGEELASRSYTARAQAADALAAAGNLDKLAEAACSGDWPAAQVACAALERLGPKASGVVGRLTPAASAAVEGKRLGTARLLVRTLRVIDREALSAVMPAISERLASEDPEIVRVACRAVEAAGPDGAPATEALVAVMSGQDARLAELAAAASEAIGPSARKAAPAVRALFKHADPNIRTQALQALVALGREALVEGLPDALPVLADPQCCVIMIDEWVQQKSSWKEDRQSTIEPSSYLDHVLELAGPAALKPVAAFLAEHWANVNEDKRVLAPLFNFTGIAARRLSRNGPDAAAMLMPILQRIVERQDDGRWEVNKQYRWRNAGIKSCLVEAMKNIESGGTAAGKPEKE